MSRSGARVVQRIVKGDTVAAIRGGLGRLIELAPLIPDEPQLATPPALEVTARLHSDGWVDCCCQFSLEIWKWARVDRRTTGARALRCLGSGERESLDREGGGQVRPVGVGAGFG